MGRFRLRRFYIVIIIMTAVVIVVLNISIVAANLFGLLSGLSLGLFSRRCGFGLAFGGGLFRGGRLGVVADVVVLLTLSDVVEAVVALVVAAADELSLTSPQPTSPATSIFANTTNEIVFFTLLLI